MSNRQWFGFSVPSGYQFEKGDLVSVDQQRPAIVRRVECWQCPHFRRSMFPYDDEGNLTPKYYCQRLDIDNQKIQEENTRRHPTEQLNYLDCVFGKIEDIPLPYMPRNASDIIPR